MEQKKKRWDDFQREKDRQLRDERRNQQGGGDGDVIVLRGCLGLETIHDCGLIFDPPSIDDLPIAIGPTGLRQTAPETEKQTSNGPITSSNALKRPLNNLIPKAVDKTVDKTVKMAKTAKITLENHWLLVPVRTVVLASTGPTAWPPVERGS
ncbi:hypothetical protein G7054_g454 [Neopestalotiopsis clavispora]|nr:hypothetical protein G7054_g454 [Neopestalotiopsis clavispora]